jgi:GrpB-like predicted nucleotidyltransferase (UPF0157 family)
MRDTDFGLVSGELRLAVVGPEWARRFATERERISVALGAAALDIQHVGSTAVPGILAKPILDIAVAVRTFELGYPLVPLLIELGYEYRGENGIARRHYFVRGVPKRTHHLHVLEPGSAQLSRHLGFRDLLRRSPTTAARYSELKSAIEAQVSGKRDRYQDLKFSFINEVMADELRHDQ